ncbi:unnamed protein product [Cuscuta europaea]|uniref:MSP domain-containing protein n=1 Tax=Cuscuta europaea TaxID=41803 RepID=A0A9P0YNW9_CUSEU|nr:unnamed protein product [Cuscuta europaea]
MSTEELLTINHFELKFPFELRKPISCSFELLNRTDNHAAFKVKTTNPRKYIVRPNYGIVLPRSRCNVTVTMQAQSGTPLDMQSKDKFLLQCVITHPGAAPKDICQEMFNKEVGKYVQECKLKVVYVTPRRPPSPVPEEPEESKVQILKLVDERDTTIQKNGKLRRELESLKRRDPHKRAMVPILYAFLVGLIGILMGYCSS